MKQLLTISGKSKQVFTILELLARKQPDATLADLEKWIAETLRRRNDEDRI